MSIEELTYPEVTLARTGLKAVICQLRFPPLLWIAHEPPLRFQELLRGSYPKLQSRENMATLQLQIGGEGGEPLPNPTRESPGAVKWLFRTEDETWTVSLGTNTLGLETTSYEDFPSFATRFREVLEALGESYPTIDEFHRIGLRYVNIFSRSDFADGDWVPRFNPTLLGPVVDDRIGSSVVAALQLFTIAESDWTINVRHGSEDDGYRLDMDHATQTAVPTSGVMERLQAFNRRLYQVFRWAISEDFYNEMEPGEPR